MTDGCWRAARASCRPWRSGWRGPRISSTSTGLRSSTGSSSRTDSCAIGAGVRHAAFHRPVVAGPLGQLLSFVVRHIAHYPIRTRGTFCGSLAHADPASEWCLTAATLGAEMVAASTRGTRTIAADDFFDGIMTTALAEDELLVEARLPLLADDARFGFYEFSRRAGDYALAMALVTYRLEDGAIVEPRVGIGGAETQPRRIAEAEQALAGSAPNDAVFRAAADAAAEQIDPHGGHAGERRVPARPRAHRHAPRPGARGRMSAHAKRDRVLLGSAARSGGSRIRRWSPALVASPAICRRRNTCASCAAPWPPDASCASRRPKSATVVTAADLKDVKPIRPMLHKFNYVPVGQPILADGVVRYVGEAIAAVLADSAEAAEDIADRVEVEIEESAAGGRCACGDRARRPRRSCARRRRMSSSRGA